MMNSSDVGSMQDDSSVASRKPPSDDSIATILAILWAAVPAIQYLGAWQRTSYQVKLLVPDTTLAALDLTPWYVLLLSATLLFASLRFLRRRESLPA